MKKLEDECSEKKVLNLANSLTLIRIASVPLIILSFYFTEPYRNFFSFTVFVFAGVTDFFDGFFARSRGETSALGRFFDPIADKLLISTTLLMLSGFGKISKLSLIPSVIIISREIIISGVREFLLSINFELKVSKFSKIKTVMQIVAVSFLLLSGVNNKGGTELIGVFLLWIASFFTIYTGAEYLKIMVKMIRNGKFN